MCLSSSAPCLFLFLLMLSISVTLTQLQWANIKKQSQWGEIFVYLCNFVFVVHIWVFGLWPTSRPPCHCQGEVEIRICLTLYLSICAVAHRWASSRMAVGRWRPASLSVATGPSKAEEDFSTPDPVSLSFRPDLTDFRPAWLLPARFHWLSLSVTVAL